MVEKNLLEPIIELAWAPEEDVNLDSTIAPASISAFCGGSSNNPLVVLRCIPWIRCVW